MAPEPQLWLGEPKTIWDSKTWSSSVYICFPEGTHPGARLLPFILWPQLVSASSHTVISSESLLSEGLTRSLIWTLKFHPRGSFHSVILACSVSSHVSIRIPPLLMASGSPKGSSPFSVVTGGSGTGNFPEVWLDWCPYQCVGTAQQWDRHCLSQCIEHLGSGSNPCPITSCETLEINFSQTQFSHLKMGKE